jgi:hypothetical protein
MLDYLFAFNPPAAALASSAAAALSAFLLYQN